MDWAFDKEPMIKFCDLLFDEQTRCDNLVFFTDVSFKKISSEIFEIKYSRWDAINDECATFFDFSIPTSVFIAHRFIQMHKKHILGMAQHLKNNERAGAFACEGVPFEYSDPEVECDGASTHDLTEEQQDLLAGILEERIEMELCGFTYEDMVEEDIKSKGHPKFIEILLLDIKRKYLEEMVHE